MSKLKTKIKIYIFRFRFRFIPNMSLFTIKKLIKLKINNFKKFYILYSTFIIMKIRDFNSKLSFI
jgi:hypothetical protein